MQYRRPSAQASRRPSTAGRVDPAELQQTSHATSNSSGGAGSPRAGGRGRRRKRLVRHRRGRRGPAEAPAGPRERRGRVRRLRLRLRLGRRASPEQASSAEPRFRRAWRVRRPKSFVLLRGGDAMARLRAGCRRRAFASFRGGGRDGRPVPPPRRASPFAARSGGRRLGEERFGGRALGNVLGGDALRAAGLRQRLLHGGRVFRAFLTSVAERVTARVVLPPEPLPFAFLPRVAMAGIMPVPSAD